MSPAIIAASRRSTRASAVVANNARGLVAVGEGAKILVGHSVLTGNGDPALFGLQGAWQTVNGGTIFSYGDNYIDGNGSMESAPPGIAHK